MKKTHVQKIEQAFDIFTKTHLVMTQFFKYPSLDFTLSETAKNTNLSKATVSRIIQELKAIGFVTVKDLGVIYRIKANGDSPVYRREKVMYNLHMLIRSNIVEFLIQKFNNPKCIVLFGSYRKGEDDKGSDIDVAIEVPEGTKTGIFRFEELKGFEKIMERHVNVQVYSRKEIDGNLFASIANGILLYGFLEVSK
jgi:predicted nucleotidyltransferase